MRELLNASGIDNVELSPCQAFFHASNVKSLEIVPFLTVRTTNEDIATNISGNKVNIRPPISTALPKKDAFPLLFLALDSLTIACLRECFRCSLDVIASAVTNIISCTKQTARTISLVSIL